ncbi:helix-turn-helix transcriptional regulator [uncultured Ramlibacter sp.]|uniref:helix-turn-helix domain-containing protein n=1 Tax=uncultured Ramlibacter sp. TaxID=260755 RepID=UPI00261E84BF|nr:helix-turn-helix transcriptional regulator [uncultured Ramlibacter sp.]
MRKPADAKLIQALAAEIKSRRSTLGISQEELAHRAGLNRTFVGKIEIAATQPSFTVLFGLATALNVTVVELVRAIEVRVRKEFSGHREPKASK